MNLSKEDMFCEGQGSLSTSAAASTNTLDFHNHGDDILHQLFWSVWIKTAADKAKLTVKWETSDYETFVDESGSASKTELYSKLIETADLAAGKYPIWNETLPRGLKRYNRLTFTGTSTAGQGETPTYPTVTAFLHDGRVEGQPLTHA